jgi:hypothetical protein
LGNGCGQPVFLFWDWFRIASRPTEAPQRRNVLPSMSVSHQALFKPFSARRKALARPGFASKIVVQPALSGISKRPHQNSRAIRTSGCVPSILAQIPPSRAPSLWGQSTCPEVSPTKWHNFFLTINSGSRVCSPVPRLAPRSLSFPCPAPPGTKERHVWVCLIA